MVRAIWTLALAGALLAGGWATRLALAARSRAPFTATATTDTLLAAVPGASSAAIAAALAALPADQAVLLVARDDDPWATQVAFTLSLLALPRPVGVLACGSEAVARVPLAPDGRLGALLVLGDPAPAGAQPLGSRLALLRLPAASTSPPWNRWCSPSPSPSS